MVHASASHVDWGRAPYDLNCVNYIDLVSLSSLLGGPFTSPDLDVRKGQGILGLDVSGILKRNKGVRDKFLRIDGEVDGETDGEIDRVHTDGEIDRVLLDMTLGRGSDTSDGHGSADATPNTAARSYDAASVSALLFAIYTTCLVIMRLFYDRRCVLP